MNRKLDVILVNWHDVGQLDVRRHSMPYKYRESRRHNFTKAKYKGTNWPDYNEALRRRGDMTIWFAEEVIDQWHPFGKFFPCHFARPKGS